MTESLLIWHKFIETQDPALLESILHPEAVFHSPVVWKPKEGRAMVIAILTAASEVFAEFKYVREVIDSENAVLEFEAKIGELTLRGVDIIKFDADGQIVDFEVMVRPANAMQALGMAMAAKIAALPN